MSKAVEEALTKAKVAYFESGPRSTAKIEPIHKLVAKSFEKKGLLVAGKGVGIGKEIKVAGAYYDKDIDVTVFKGNNPQVAVEVKNPVSNYGQNDINYFENMMGYTNNLHDAGLQVGYYMVLPIKLPYFNKNKEIIRIETINDSQINKYRKLYERRSNGCPDFMGIRLVNYFSDDFLENRTKYDIEPVTLFSDYSEIFSKRNTKFLKSIDNLTRLASKVHESVIGDEKILNNGRADSMITAAHILTEKPTVSNKRITLQDGFHHVQTKTIGI